MIGKPSYIVSEYSYWNELSINPNAIPILEQNLDQINWENLSMNPYAIHILEKNLDKVEWSWLSKNPNAIPILEKNKKKIEWINFQLNPNVIQLVKFLDTEKMRENCKTFAEELTAYVFHPSRLVRLCNTYGLDLEEYFECV